MRPDGSCGAATRTFQGWTNLSLVTFRDVQHFVVGCDRWFSEGWIKNAFDTRYVPVAFSYNSAYWLIGESGASMTCGFRAGVNF